MILLFHPILYDEKEDEMKEEKDEEHSKERAVEEEEEQKDGINKPKKDEPSEG